MHLTPTQQRFYDALMKGPCTAAQLLKLMDDDLATNYQPHLTRLRLILRPIGQTVIAERFNGSVVYRLVRHVNNRE